MEEGTLDCLLEFLAVFFMDEGCLDWELGFDSRLYLVVFLLDVHRDPLITLLMLRVALLCLVLEVA